LKRWLKRNRPHRIAQLQILHELQKGFLFNSARTGNVTAQFFWLKTRARETPTGLKRSGSIGRKELCEYSDEQLMAVIREGAAKLGPMPMKTITQDGGDAVPVENSPRLVYPARLIRARPIAQTGRPRHCGRDHPAGKWLLCRTPEPTA